MKLIFLTLLLMMAFIPATFCQEFIFKDGDRVCFIGSSITMNGANFHYINLYYATRYPERKVTFLNSGISGDATDNILARIDSDIISNHPTWAVLMLEENDLRPSLYYKARENEPGIIEKKQKALENWFNNADTIVQKLQQANIKVILQTPTIYDQTGNFPSENALGLNDSLEKCAAYLARLAAKYNLPLVDCWTILNDVNKEIQHKDLTKTIIGNDRVHVSKLGHFVMAYQFLKTQHACDTVSFLTIEAKRNEVTQQVNCVAGNLKRIAGNISFSCQGKSLPYPSPDGLNVDSLFPFTNEMNAEIIRVKGLPAGKYKLSIDTGIPGIYSSEELKKGINLSWNKNTPQYQQARQVLSLFDEYWKTEGVLRKLKYVEYQHHINDFKNKENMEELKKKFAEILEENKASDNYTFFKNIFDIYLANKPKEKEFEANLENILNKIREVSLPRKHTFKIDRIN